MKQLEQRMNSVADRLLSPELLTNAGLGNNAGFHVFDYPAEQELRVRDFINTVLNHLAKRRPGLRVCHINLFHLLLEYLQHRGFLEKSYKKQHEEGDEALLQSLKGPLKEQKIARYFTETVTQDEQDLILVSGVGNAWPLLRSHTLLNNLHALLTDKPLVLFYPGNYDGQNLRLFGRLKENNYYRALRLVP